MENSALGTFGKRLVAWIVIAAAAVLALKLVVGMVVGFFATIVVLVLAVSVVAGLVWAFRHA